MTTIKRVFVTGNQGYIGSVLVEHLAQRGYDVVGLDAGIFRDVQFVPRIASPPVQLRKDVREVEAGDLEGIDAVIHLAALSNDPLGALNPELTYAINHRASVRLAALAKRAGVSRLLFSSSCSMYGVSTAASVNEGAPFNPQTAYAESKVLAERDIAALAGDGFSPVFLRNATVFGVSPRMRLDLVVQNLAAYGYLYGVITILSDGTPWRPLVHIRDVADAFVFLLEAPAAEVHNRAFNVGHKDNNVQIREIAAMVRDAIPGTAVEIKNENPSDARSYRVDFSRLQRLGFTPRRTVRDGIEEICDVFKRVGFTEKDFESDRYNTLARYKRLLETGGLDASLRLVSP